VGLSLWSDWHQLFAHQDDGKLKAFADKGATIVVVDPSDQAALTAALKGAPRQPLLGLVP
jgi:hypothetical protein